MKKIIDCILKSTLILTVLFGYTFYPVNTKAVTIKQGQTLADLRADLKALQKEKVESQNKQKKTQSEIDAEKNNIASANHEIEEANLQISLLTEAIENTNTEISKLKEDTESLLLLYQKLETENIYLSYITGATSMTELIMRMDAINQVTEYNQEKLNDLELLIKNNEKMSDELEDYQVTLNSKIETYEENIKSLDRDLADLVEGAEDINSEIAGVKELINYYEKVGCKENEDLC